MSSVLSRTDFQSANDRASQLRRAKLPGNTTESIDFSQSTAPSIHWRFELKYMVSRHQRSALLRDLRCFMTTDTHGFSDGAYRVRSLYLDSCDWSGLHDKLDGQPIRRKLRVRMYLAPESADVIKLEIKCRQSNRTGKWSLSLDHREFCRLRGHLNGFRWPEPDLLKSIPAIRTFWSAKQQRGLRPTFNIEFRRTALVSRSRSEFRVTLDDSICAKRARNLHDSMTGAVPIVNRDVSILEIKSGHSIPAWLHFVIRKYRLTSEPFSKYGRAVALASFGAASTA